MKETHTKRRPFWSIRKLLLLVAVAVPVIGLLLLPWFEGAQRQQSDGSAHVLMLEIIRAQYAFQAAAVVDQDGDGTGEYGTLRELVGDWSRRQRPAAPAIAPALKVSGVRWENVADGEVMVADGFCYRIFLPTATGTARPDSRADPAPVPADADRQELTFAVYAWPWQAGVTGTRAYAGAAGLAPDFC